VILGQDEQLFNQAPDGKKSVSGIGGAGDADGVAKPYASPPECQGYSITSGFGNPTAHAEVWRTLNVVGHYPADARITLPGYWTAAITDMAGGAGAQWKYSSEMATVMSLMTILS